MNWGWGHGSDTVWGHNFLLANERSVLLPEVIETGAVNGIFLLQGCCSPVPLYKVILKKMTHAVEWEKWLS